MPSAAAAPLPPPLQQPQPLPPSGPPPPVAQARWMAPMPQPWNVAPALAAQQLDQEQLQPPQQSLALPQSLAPPQKQLTQQQPDAEGDEIAQLMALLGVG